MTTTALIVADNSPPRGALVRKLDKTGLFGRVMIRDAGEESPDLLQTEKIDLICWAYTPQENTPAWIAQLKHHPDWRDIPLLAFAKEKELDSCRECLELDGCETVGFTMPTDELTICIVDHLKRAEQIGYLRNRRAKLAQLALNDPLTGLGNRASFDLRLRQEVSHSRHSGKPFALMLIDLDHFKWFNGCYGHQAGDTILKAVARALKQTLRDTDLSCRYGGEEFAVILPGMTSRNAQSMAARLHEALAELSAELWENQQSLSASIGLTCFDGTRLVDSGELLAEVDNALGQAKQNGHNRTEIHLPPRAVPYFGPESVSVVSAHS